MQMVQINSADYTLLDAESPNQDYNKDDPKIKELADEVGKIQLVYASYYNGTTIFEQFDLDWHL